MSIRIATEQPRARGGPLRYPRPWASPALRCPSTHLAASSQSTRSREKRQTEESSGRACRVLAVPQALPPSTTHSFPHPLSFLAALCRVKEMQPEGQAAQLLKNGLRRTTLCCRGSGVHRLRELKWGDHPKGGRGFGVFSVRGLAGNNREHSLRFSWLGEIVRASPIAQWASACSSSSQQLREPKPWENSNT